MIFFFIKFYFDEIWRISVLPAWLGLSDWVAKITATNSPKHQTPTKGFYLLTG
jgi:hypothetical protein